MVIGIDEQDIGPLLFFRCFGLGHDVAQCKGDADKQESVAYHVEKPRYVFGERHVGWALIAQRHFTVSSVS